MAPPAGRRWRRLAALLGLSVVASVVAAVVISHLRPSLLPDGSVAPRFGLVGDDGATHTLPQGVAVVEFFETTCPHCRQSAPELCRIAGSHRGVPVIAVDAALEGVDSLRGFRRELLGGCPSASDPALLTDPEAKVTHQYKVDVVPTVYVIDTSGRIAYSGVGEGAVQGVAAVLDRILAASTP